VIVHEPNVVSVRTLPPKDDPPLVVDADAVEPLQIALERLETVAGQPCMSDPSLTPIGGAGWQWGVDLGLVAAVGGVLLLVLWGCAELELGGPRIGG